MSTSYDYLWLDHELKLGDEVLLPSHGYPNNYPNDAYVLWTFQYAPGEDSTNIVYQISFGYLRISSHDYLIIGYGWDPRNTTALVILYGDNYYDSPRDYLVSAGNSFVEFDTSQQYTESNGFRLTLAVRNITGTWLCMLAVNSIWRTKTKFITLYISIIIHLLLPEQHYLCFTITIYLNIQVKGFREIGKERVLYDKV